MEKVDPLDMMRARVFEAELNELHAKAEMKTSEFQEFIDRLFAKHEMIKGVDRLEVDGTIVRGAR